MSWKIAFAAAAGLMTLSAAAPQTAAARSPVENDKPKRQCFWADRISSFAAQDDRTVNVRVGVKDIYQFELLGHCPEVDWTQQIAVVSRGGSSICSGLDATIVTPSAIGPQRCTVRTVRKLSEAEVKALPPKAKP